MRVKFEKSERQISQIAKEGDFARKNFVAFILSSNIQIWRWGEAQVSYQSVTRTSRELFSFSHSSDNRFFWIFSMNTARKKDETFTEFQINFVLTRNINIIRLCAVVAKNQQKITLW